MSRAPRQSLRALLAHGAAAALAGLALSGCSRPAPDVPPHIVLIVCEGLGADQLQLYGHAAPAAPQLAAWADDALVFDRATAPSPETRASVYALFTGRHPTADRRLDQLQRLPDSETVLPEVLAAAGYDTVAMSDSPLVSVALGAARGFTSFVDLGWTGDVTARRALEHATPQEQPDQQPAAPPPNAAAPMAPAAAADTIARDADAGTPAAEDIGLSKQIRDADAAELVAVCLEPTPEDEASLSKWVQTAMLAVCERPSDVIEPAAPAAPPAHAATAPIEATSPEPDVSADTMVDRVASLLRERHDRARPLFLFLDLSECRLPSDPTPGSAAETRARASERLARLDAALARLNALTAELLTDRPVVTVLTSDHGAWPGEGSALGPSVLRVPLIVHGAGPTGRVAERVGLVDVTPTLAALADVAAPRNIDGESLLGAAGVPADARRVAIEPGRAFVAYRAGPGPGVQGAGELAVLRDGWRAERHGEHYRLIEEASGEDVTEYRADLLPQLGNAAAHWFSRSLQRAQRQGIARSGARVQPPPDVAQRLAQLGYAGL